ncbi:MAG: AEC family transporter [Dokdonella sp.]
MTVFATFAIILVLLVIGYLLNLWRVVPENASATLNLVVLNVCLPAAILLYAPKLEFERELIGLVAVPWVILIVSTALVFLLARVFRLDRPSTANLLLQIPLGNTSYIGYSLIPVLVGAGALRYAVVYDQLGSFLILTTWGLFVISLYGGGERLRLQTILRRVLLFPPFIALVLALSVVPSTLAPMFDQGLHLLADALLPIVVLALGMQLRLRLPRHHVLPLCFGLLAKLILMPLVAFGLAHLFGLSEEMLLVAVYLTAMPPMVTSGALLSMAGLAPELAAALIGYGIVISMLTLPLWDWWLSG